MKIAPLIDSIERHNASSNADSIEPILVHTGQHYDYRMSQIFFQELELPEPDFYLGVGSGTHAEQTGRVMIEFEKVLLKEKPDLVMVVGDVNSTLAGALAAAKLHIPVAHVEAGLRSYDRSMPEETNRLLTDAISDYLFTPSADADENLKKEGIAEKKIFLVGNVMVDSLLGNRERAMGSDILPRLGLEKESYAVLTLHRPENVDHRDSLARIAAALAAISRRISIVFPCHPRTRETIAHFGLGEFFHSVESGTSANLDGNAVHLIAPLGYLDFLQLMMNSRFVMTDSGGIQEETTALNIPCITLRNNTERPITVAEGTNVVVGTRRARILAESLRVLSGKHKKGKVPPLWDGKAAERIVRVLRRNL